MHTNRLGDLLIKKKKLKDQSSNRNAMKQLDFDLKRLYRMFFLNCNFSSKKLARNKHKIYKANELHVYEVLKTFKNNSKHAH